MQVKEAIEYLTKLDPEEHIVIAWWEKDYFFHWLDEDYDLFDPPVTEKEWEDASIEADKIDWSYTHESIYFAMRHWIEEERKEDDE
tara:strand:+ start:251 stop:508 length:258 start_codon:yes stop_codon:yes gene_type:complete